MQWKRIVHVIKSATWIHIQSETMFIECINNSGELFGDKCLYSLDVNHLCMGINILREN